MARTPNAVCTGCGTAYCQRPSRLATSRFCSNECRQADRFAKVDLQRLYYDEQWSMQQIADYFECSLNKIVYWMDKYGLVRRDASEATYLHKNPDGDPFQIVMPKTAEGWKLFGAGLALYMGEGSKTGNPVSLSNSNPAIHKIFINFLEQICGVNRSQLHGSLNIFDDISPEEAISWWANELGLVTNQFYSPHIRSHKGGSYNKKSKYGTLSLAFENIKLKKIILEWCDEYYSQFD